MIELQSTLIINTDGVTLSVYRDGSNATGSIASSHRNSSAAAARRSGAAGNRSVLLSDQKRTALLAAPEGANFSMGGAFDVARMRMRVGRRD